MKGSNGATNQVNGAVARSTPNTANCPACGSPISADQYERILRIDLARKKALDGERAKLDAEREALESEHDALDQERKAIAEAAVEAARATWEADKARIVREFARLEKEAAKEKKRVERERDKERKALAARQAASEEKLARQLAAERTKMRQAAEARIRDAKREAAEGQKAEVADLREQLKTSEQRRARDEAGYKKSIDEMKRKVDARDRQHLGPEGEEQLIAVLRAEFPADRIEHHGKGGDVLQVVMVDGREAGRLVYEVKNRSTWSADYIMQTQLAAEKHDTPHAILVSRVLPAPKTGMCIMRNVIVVAPVIAVHVASVVRDGIIAVHRLTTSEEGKSAKMAALFEYLRGQEFAMSMSRIAVKLTELHESLGRERSQHEGTWNRREQTYAAIARESSAVDGRVRDLLGGLGVAKTNGKPAQTSGVTAA